MYIISAEALITNFFGENENEEVLTIADLYRYRTYIENYMNRTMSCWCYIDVSEESIVNAVESNPKYFKFNMNRSAIVFKKELINEFYTDLLGIFNSRIDSEIRYKFLEAIEHCLAKFDVNSLVGLTYEDAVEQCTVRGYNVCVLIRDNVPFPITCDFRFDRVGFYIEDNIIVNAEIG